MRRSAVILAIALFAVPAFADERGPAKEVPELEALKHYQGTWDVEFTTPGLSGGESRAYWILGGRFLEQTGTLRAADGNEFIVKTIYTYDTRRKTYRSWTWTSNGSTGSISEATMKWDPSAKTMTSTMQRDPDGTRTTVTADFSKPGKEHWKFMFFDSNGVQSGEIAGVNTRRAATAEPRQHKPEPVAQPSNPLERFVGEWKAEYRLAKAEWTPEEKRSTAELRFTRELAGLMVRERIQHADKTENTYLMMPDPQGNDYRAWWFSSAGLFGHASGKWSEATQSFQWTRVDDEGIRTVAEHRFLGNKLEWTVLIENRDKVVMFRMDGTATRK